jgi:formate hydrogenlyase subunit 3/multisubunit Na+/H+ antiporter MnhD subunit
MALDLPARAVLSRWQPLPLTGVSLALEVDTLSWLFALGLLSVALAALVTGLSRPGGRRVGTRLTMLLLASAGLVAVFSENLLTRVLAWALLDAVCFLALLFLAEADGLEPQAVLNLALNSAGTLLAVAAAVLISRTSPDLSLRDAALTPQSTLLITLAAVFRLGLFPLHLGLPTEINIRQGLGALLRLVPATVALETVSRLAVFGFAPALRPWLSVFGVAAALAGAARLWNIRDPRQGLAYLLISQSGVALLAGLWGGQQASLWVAAVVLALLLGSALIFLSNGHDEQRPVESALPLLGAAALVGAPLTVGFYGFGSLFAALLAGGPLAWLVLLGVVAAQVLLAAGLLNAVFWPGQPMSGEPFLVAAYWGGLSLLAVLLLITGLFGSALAGALGVAGVGVLGFAGFGSIAAALLVALTAGGGFALWRYQDLVRASSAEVVSGALASLTRLDWLYRFVWTGVRGAGTAVDGLAAVLEGEGAILWTLVAGVVVWLLLAQ